MLRSLLSLYLILILATTASTNLAQDQSFPKEGLQQYAKIFDNCELSYTRKEASGETAVVGLFRSREGQSQVEFQYTGDATRLHVNRRDASFLLDQTESNPGTWIPSKLSPGSGGFQFVSMGGVFGPDHFLHTFSINGKPLWLFLEPGSALLGYRLSELRETSPNHWEILLVNEKPNGTSRWFLEGSPIVRCTKQESTFQVEKWVKEFSYDEIDGIPYVRSIQESLNGVPQDRIEVEWISTKAAPEKYFRLDHYGLSESLLRPANPNSPWEGSTYLILIGIGVVLLILSVVFRIRSAR
jgi:hypothetical protein